MLQVKSIHYFNENVLGLDILYKTCVSFFGELTLQPSLHPIVDKENIIPLSSTMNQKIQKKKPEPEEPEEPESESDILASTPDTTRLYIDSIFGPNTDDSETHQGNEQGEEILLFDNSSPDSKACYSTNSFNSSSSYPTTSSSSSPSPSTTTTNRRQQVSKNPGKPKNPKSGKAVGTSSGSQQSAMVGLKQTKRKPGSGEAESEQKIPVQILKALPVPSFPKFTHSVDKIAAEENEEEWSDDEKASSQTHGPGPDRGNQHGFDDDITLF